MNLINRDLQCIWHPCSQMKDYESFPPLIIKKAYGSYIELKEGRKIIDAISSWWCKSLGHNHPRLKSALKAQCDDFEHVIFANSTHEIIIQLSEKLSQICRGLNKVFYASEGSSAVEIALKMSLHAQRLCGQTQRIQFTALQNGYHGETFMALGLSDLGLYRSAYEAHLIQPKFIQNIPYVHSTTDPLWHDCSSVWPPIEEQLEKQAKNLAAIIVEPIVQGAGGMKIYSQDFLYRLRKWTKAHGIYLIADEIMTGLGRTGRILACEYAKIKPDFICLSKGLTSGWLPMSVVLTHDRIYNLFYDDYNTGKSFLHSHTFSGNALAAAIGLECFAILEDEKIIKQVNEKEIILRTFMEEVNQETNRLVNIRGIGAIVAADLALKENEKNQRIGYRIFQHALDLGAWLRPLGNTIYWLPPLNITLSTLEELRDITILSIKRLFNNKK